MMAASRYVWRWDDNQLIERLSEAEATVLGSGGWGQEDVRLVVAFAQW